MNANAQARREAPDGSGPTYTCTLGVFNQTTPWTDVRSYSWSELGVLLCDHQIGPKEGTCIVPAVFVGTRRTNAKAKRIDLVFLDIDVGMTLQEISAAIATKGYAAIISSTHSHLVTRTSTRRDNWDKFRAAATDPATSPAGFLVTEKGYLPRIAAGATLVHEDAEYAVFEHQPCPKFRVVIPLLRPWEAASFKSQREANNVWKESVNALAASLGLSHDQACTDTSRLFFMPRRPSDRPPPETTLRAGAPCDIFALPKAKSNGNRRRQGAARGAMGLPPTRVEYTDPETGEVRDLTAWAETHGDRFQIVAALSARSPDVFTGKEVESKHHIRCANEQAHSQAGVDAATFVMNASDSTNRGFVYHCRHSHCDGVDRLDFLWQMLEDGWLTWADLHNPDFLTEGAPARRCIRVVPGQLPDIVDQAEQALLEGDVGLYQRGSFIVRPGAVRISIANGNEIVAQRILEVGEHALVEAMTAAADWERYDARKRKWTAIDAPMVVAKSYLQRTGRWDQPVLAGILSAPTLRADGSILSFPGYDRATGLLLDTGGARFPSVSDQPTKTDAAAALQTLSDLIASFPFVNRPSRAVALSAILTACIRRSLPGAPMHAFSAPTAGSGKSKLVDVASLIATGREAGVISQGRTEEELEKRLGALLLAGDQVIAIDNCEAPLGGEFLCCALTQRVVRTRILGRSEAPELPADTFITATGNNLALAGDLTRRAVLCRLDSKEERPELRKFPSDPIAIVKADRGRYLVAALTILRAYHVAGRPERPDPLGSYEIWSDWVRGALLWLGEADPVATMEGVRESDPKLDALSGVLEQWREIIGNATVSARDVIDRATEQVTASGFYAEMESRRPDFREALLAVAGEGGAINSRRLGKWLASNQNKVVQGHRLIRASASGGVARWRVEAVTEVSADDGVD